MNTVDVAIIGAGPAGLSATLQLARGMKSIALFDGDARRNRAAAHVNGFLTRDHIPPDAFRAAARADFARYPAVSLVDQPVVAIEGSVDQFVLRTAHDSIGAARIILALGVRDVMPALPGFAELWGTRIVTCPYCHGWEQRGQRFGVLVDDGMPLEHAQFLRGWTADVMFYPMDQVAALETDGDAVVVVAYDGSRTIRDLIFARPKQVPVPLVSTLGVELDGPFIKVDAQQRTSIPGIYAAGDIQTMMQSALFAAQSGGLAAVHLNRELTMSRL